jgi:glutamine amidotransferase
VGAFPKAMQELRRRGLFEPVRDYRGPLLGICLGMQLLFESSPEMGGDEGLGLLAGEVTALHGEGLKVPQIGWNEVSWSDGAPLTDGLPERIAMYHVHSFAARPADESDVIGTAEYGERFATAVARGNVYGVQFHPEKSSSHGLALLRNFVRLAS